MHLQPELLAEFPDLVSLILWRRFREIGEYFARPKFAHPTQPPQLPRSSFTSEIILKIFFTPKSISSSHFRNRKEIFKNPKIFILEFGHLLCYPGVRRECARYPKSLKHFQVSRRACRPMINHLPAGSFVLLALVPMLRVATRFGMLRVPRIREKGDIE
jgi:hypothetical protein